MVQGTEESIEVVVKNGLCCGCGTCAGICPKNAITLVIDENKGVYIPNINKNKCACCGICYDACPGHAVDFKALNKDIFGGVPEDILMGSYQACYLGHAIDNAVRYNAASGGAITAILLFALETGMIDGALVTRMRKDRPLEPEPFIARTRDEILEAAKSKYCPVPTNITLNKILDSKDGERFAVVGLPCHIHGIRKAESINKRLKDKIVLRLGIFCSHTDTFWQTKFLLKKLNISEENVAKIDYRGDGWPGMMSILLKNGRKVRVPFSEAVALHGLWIHALPRCLFCCDLTAELADISCGDPWLPEIEASGEKMGKSIVVSRTNVGNAVCMKAKQCGYMQLEEIDPEKVKQSGNMMESKKRDITVRFLIRRLFNRAVPEYNTTFLRPSSINYLRSLLVYFNVDISYYTCLRRFVILISRVESWLFQKF